MILSTGPTLALVCGLLPLAIGEALGTPVLLAATEGSISQLSGIYETGREATGASDPLLPSVDSIKPVLQPSDVQQIETVSKPL